MSAQHIEVAGNAVQDLRHPIRSTFDRGAPWAGFLGLAPSPGG